MSNKLSVHLGQLKSCNKCPDMIGPVVVGLPVNSKILLVGQAPGDKEGDLGKPFAWTAGKTLFKWFESIGLSEEEVRARIYFSAVCRCFPGKNEKGGDRVPSKDEISNCAGWLEQEIKLLRPQLVIPVGKLAINQFLKVGKLKDVIGKVVKHEDMDIVCLPHPSGASTWHRMEPGISLLKKALSLIKKHPSYAEVLNS